MNAITILVIVSMLAMVGVLIAGGISMVRGGRFDLLHSFPLMEARVAFGVVTVVLLLIAVFFW